MTSRSVTVAPRQFRRPGGRPTPPDHTGFTGIGGFFLAKLPGSVRKKMLTEGLPPVPDDLL
jgi:hypothetical protein